MNGVTRNSEQWKGTPSVIIPEQWAETMTLMGNCSHTVTNFELFARFVIRINIIFLQLHSIPTARNLEDFSIIQLFIIFLA